LAGLPKEVVARSREILAALEGEEGERQMKREVAAAKLRSKPAVQLAFFEQKEHPIVAELLALNVMALTPLEAINLLYTLQAKAKQGGG
jgi:DNA mismatch repair protein MutS